MSNTHKSHLEELCTLRMEIGYYKGLLAAHGIQVESFGKTKTVTKGSKIIKHDFKKRVVS